MRENWITRWSKLIVIGDRECPAISYARKEGLDNFVFNFKEPEQIALTQIVISLEPDLIITTVNSILCTSFLNQLEPHQHIFNLHYSLLPAFSGSFGKKTFYDTQNYGPCLIGATVFNTSEVLDYGRPKVQIALPYSPADTIEDMMDSNFRAGCFALLTALKIAEDLNPKPSIGKYLIIKKRPALINPSVINPEKMSRESFWGALKS
jgi:phosphoribosylglycinamide formyltransferase-1